LTCSEQTLLDPPDAASHRRILACIAFTLPTSRFFQYTLAFFWLMAFSSADT